MLERPMTALRALPGKGPTVLGVKLVLAGLLLVGAVAVVVLIGLLRRFEFAEAAAIPPAVLLYVVWATSKVTRWSWIEASRRWFAVPLAIGSALLPLLVPLLVIATYAARVLNLGVQILFGVLAAVMLLAALINEREGSRAMFDAVFRWPGRVHGRRLVLAAGGTVVIVIVPLLVLTAVVFDLGVYRFGGRSAALQLVGLAYLALALGFRVVGFYENVPARGAVLVFLGICALVSGALWGHEAGTSDVVAATQRDRDEERRILLTIIGGLAVYSLLEGRRG